MNRVKVFASLALVTIAASWMVSCKHAEPPAPNYDDIIKRAEQGPHALPTGRSAIKPTLSGVPSFSLNDARTYAESGRIPIGVARNVHATDAKFLTSAEVSQRLDGATTGLADDAPLCFVEMQGDFTFAGPSGATPHFTRAFEVFDAKSGNLLLSGGLPAEQTPSVR
jgi:hypothetical protein